MGWQDQPVEALGTGLGLRRAVLAELAERDYGLDFSVHDQYCVLDYFRTGWDALAPIRVRAAPAARPTLP